MTPLGSLPGDSASAMRRWQQITWGVTYRYLDLYSAAVARFAEAEVDAARTANMPMLLSFVRVHAKLQREADMSTLEIDIELPGPKALAGKVPTVTANPAFAR